MRLKLKTKIFYGIGGLGDSSLYNLFTNFMLFYLTTIVGIKPVAGGFIVAFGTIWEALCGPFIGHFSDNYDSKYGNRKPFMLAAAIPIGICTSLLFTNINAAYSVKLVYYTIMVMVFWTLFSTFFIPYLSWGAELTRDYDERTALRSYSYVFDTVGMVVSMVVPTLCVDYFMNMGKSASTSWQYMGILVSIIGSLGILLSAYNIKETDNPDYTKPVKRKSMSLDFAREIFIEYKDLINLKSLQYIIAASMIYLIANAIAAGDRMYYFTYNMGYSGWKITFLLLLFTCTGFVFTPIINKLSAHWDKRIVYIGCMLLSAVLTIAFKFIGINGMVSMCVFLVQFSIGTTVYWQLIPAMLYDVCEVDMLSCGRDRTGSVVSLQAISEAVAEAVGAQSLGIILQIAGFNGEAAMQSATALAWVENSFAVIPALLMIGSAYMIYKYPVSKRVYNDVVKAIESREAGIMPDMKQFENLM